MDINIKRTPAEERSVFRMKKGLDIRKANIQILILFALGFVPAISNSDDSNPAISYSGLLFTGASFMLYYQTHLKKWLRIKPISIPPKKDDTAESLVSLKLDDSFITTETFDRYFRIKWSLVTGYRLYKGYLLIRIGKKYVSAFVVKKDEVTPAEFDELVGFLEAKFSGK